MYLCVFKIDISKVVFGLVEYICEVNEALVCYRIVVNIEMGEGGGVKERAEEFSSIISDVILCNVKTSQSLVQY